MSGDRQDVASAADARGTAFDEQHSLFTDFAHSANQIYSAAVDLKNEIDAIPRALKFEPKGKQEEYEEMSYKLQKMAEKSITNPPPALLGRGWIGK